MHIYSLSTLFNEFRTQQKTQPLIVIKFFYFLRGKLKPF